MHTEREANTGLTVAVIMLAIIIAIVGTLYITESTKVRMNQSMLEEFVLQQRSDRTLETVTQLPSDRGVLITNKVMYSNNSDVLKAAIEKEGQQQQQQRDPLTDFLGASGIPNVGGPPHRLTVGELLDTM